MWLQTQFLFFPASKLFLFITEDMKRCVTGRIKLQFQNVNIHISPESNKEFHVGGKTLIQSTSGESVKFN